VPCGPSCWYEPWYCTVNERGVSLRNLFVFHMDECLDWQGRLLPKNHPHNFRTAMEGQFYGPVRPELAVPEAQRTFGPDNLLAARWASTAPGSRKMPWRIRCDRLGENRRLH